MANTNSAKGNPASTRMSNPKYKAKRARNLLKNENLKGVPSHKTGTQIVLEAVKKDNFGFGQRAVRRILDGTNKSHNLTSDQVMQLSLINGSTEAMRINLEKNAN